MNKEKIILISGGIFVTAVIGYLVYQAHVRDAATAASAAANADQSADVATPTVTDSSINLPSVSVPSINTGSSASGTTDGNVGDIPTDTGSLLSQILATFATGIQTASDNAPSIIPTVTATPPSINVPTTLAQVNGTDPTQSSTVPSGPPIVTTPPTTPIYAPTPGQPVQGGPGGGTGIITGHPTAPISRYPGTDPNTIVSNGIQNQVNIPQAGNPTIPVSRGHRAMPIILGE